MSLILRFWLLSRDGPDQPGPMSVCLAEGERKTICSYGTGIKQMEHVFVFIVPDKLFLNRHAKPFRHLS